MVEGSAVMTLAWALAVQSVARIAVPRVYGVIKGGGNAFYGRRRGSQ